MWSASSGKRYKNCKRHEKIVGVIPGGRELGNVISLIIKTSLLPPPVLAVAKLEPI